MKRLSTLILLVFSSFCAVLVFAQNYEVPRTQWGQPDLQGVWNFSSNVPMQRPSRFGERQFLTEEEIAEAEVRRAAVADRGEPDDDGHDVQAGTAARLLRLREGTGGPGGQRGGVPGGVFPS